MRLLHYKTVFDVPAGEPDALKQAVAEVARPLLASSRPAHRCRDSLVLCSVLHRLDASVRVRCRGASARGTSATSCQAWDATDADSLRIINTEEIDRLHRTYWDMPGLPESWGVPTEEPMIRKGGGLKPGRGR